MTIDWPISILTQDGYTIFEADGAVEYSVSRHMGADVVAVDGFSIAASRRSYDNQNQWEDRATPACFNEHSKHAWEKLLFFHVKDVLESDPDFEEAVLAQEASFNDHPRAAPFHLSHNI